MLYYINKKTIIVAVIFFIVLWILAMMSIFNNIKADIRIAEKEIQLQKITELVDSLKRKTEYQKSVIMDLEEALIKSK